ncbi:MAG: DUF937 domain-containing protein [Sphingobacteriales bacterium]|nr:DUF937 domain-containing protein [Sphingobacteriales bacterium]
MMSKVGANEEQLNSALGAVVPILTNALARNASTPEGASALHNALSNKHDGSVLDSLMDLVNNPQNGEGAGILRHVLGGSRPAVEQAVSVNTGLNQQGVGQLLEMLAPMLMGVLGRQQRQATSSDAAGGLSEWLRSAQGQMQNQAPQQMGFIGRLLDRDGDGNMMDDVMEMGFKFFTKR